MCVHFFNFDHLIIKLQSSDLFWGTKFRAPSLPLTPFILSFLQSLIHGFLWWWASLDSSSSWSGVSNHISPSPFRCHQTSRSKGLHLWRRSKAYKLHISYITNKPVEYSMLKVFGCLAYYHVSEGKLEPRTKMEFFMGDRDGIKGFRV